MASLAAASAAGAAPSAGAASAGSVSTQQQPKNLSVKGTVVDQDGLPVIGAAVMVKGDKSKGTVTDIDGRFEIKAPSGSVIEVTCLGYSYKTFTLTSSKDLRLVLEDRKSVV